MSEQDQLWIAETLSGRGEAFEQLVLKYQDRLYGSLIHILGSPDDALEIAQEAFFKAYRRLGDFRHESQFYSWLFRIAYNAAMSKRRRRSVRAGSIDQARRFGQEPTDPRNDADPSARLESLDRVLIVQQVLSELSDEYRTALVLKELDGRSYEEIAEIVDVPVGTVRSRIHRARREMRDRLERALASEEKI